MRYILGIFGLIIMGLSWSALAAPPYVAISIADDRGFSDQACISAGEAILRNDGFKRINSSGSSVFAAFNSGNNYGYKAVIRCVGSHNLFLVAVVAQSPMTIRAKADNLRAAMQNRLPVSRYSVRSEPVQTLSPQTSQISEPKRNTAKTWQDTVLGRGPCLERAEQALRQAGFTRDFEIDYESLLLSGKHQSQLSGAIRCVPDQRIVLFEVKGGSNAMNLLDELQLNF
jgi:hypothetical protein